ncbi:hypothetical protein PFISCL1PPCAC_405, partial [Pristionchus fissidentatus]
MNDSHCSLIFDRCSRVEELLIRNGRTNPNGLGFGDCLLLLLQENRCVVHFLINPSSSESKRPLGDYHFTLLLFEDGFEVDNSDVESLRGRLSLCDVRLRETEFDLARAGQDSIVAVVVHFEDGIDRCELGGSSAQSKFALLIGVALIEEIIRVGT